MKRVLDAFDVESALRFLKTQTGPVCPLNLQRFNVKIAKKHYYGVAKLMEYFVEEGVLREIGNMLYFPIEIDMEEYWTGCLEKAQLNQLEVPPTLNDSKKAIKQWKMEVGHFIFLNVLSQDCSPQSLAYIEAYQIYSGNRAVMQGQQIYQQIQIQPEPEIQEIPVEPVEPQEISLDYVAWRQGLSQFNLESINDPEPPKKVSFAPVVPEKHRKQAQLNYVVTESMSANRKMLKEYLHYNETAHNSSRKLEMLRDLYSKKTISHINYQSASLMASAFPLLSTHFTVKRTGCLIKKFMLGKTDRRFYDVAGIFKGLGLNPFEGSPLPMSKNLMLKRYCQKLEEHLSRKKEWATQLKQISLLKKHNLIPNIPVSRDPSDNGMSKLIEIVKEVVLEENKIENEVWGKLDIIEEENIEDSNFGL